MGPARFDPIPFCGLVVRDIGWILRMEGSPRGRSPRLRAKGPRPGWETPVLEGEPMPESLGLTRAAHILCIS